MSGLGKMEVTIKTLLLYYRNHSTISTAKKLIDYILNFRQFKWSQQIDSNELFKWSHELTKIKNAIYDYFGGANCS